MEQKNHAKFSAAQEGAWTCFQEALRRQVVPPQLGLGARPDCVFLAAIWLTARRALSLPAGVLDLTQLVVALGAIVTTALLLLLVQSMQTVGKCLLTIGIFIFGGLALATGFPVIGAAFQSGWWLPLALP